MIFFKKAQAWGFDLLVASAIFMLGLTIFYFYAINYPKEGEEKLDKLIADGEFISEILLSEGHPLDWDENNVIRIGLTTDKKINETKLENFYLLADNQSNPQGYLRAKSLFNTKYNFFVNFSQPIIIDNTNIVGIGSNFHQNSINLIKINRVTIYQNKPVSLNVYIWE